MTVGQFDASDEAARRAHDYLVGALLVAASDSQLKRIISTLMAGCEDLICQGIPLPEHKAVALDLVRDQLQSRAARRLDVALRGRSAT